MLALGRAPEITELEDPPPSLPPPLASLKPAQNQTGPGRVDQKVTHGTVEELEFMHVHTLNE